MTAVITDQLALDNLSVNAKALMREQDLSLRQLATKIGESHVSVFHAISGVHEPGIGIIAKLAEALGVTVDALLATPKKTRKSRVG